MAISLLCINFVFINDNFAGKWLQCDLFVPKKICLKKKAINLDEFICNVIIRRGSNIIEDVDDAGIKAPPVVKLTIFV